jgi:hypothetical protein
MDFAVLKTFGREALSHIRERFVVIEADDEKVEQETSQAKSSLDDMRLTLLVLYRAIV